MLKQKKLEEWKNVKRSDSLDGGTRLRKGFLLPRAIRSFLSVATRKTRNEKDSVMDLGWPNISADLKFIPMRLSGYLDIFVVASI